MRGFFSVFVLLLAVGVTTRVAAADVEVVTRATPRPEAQTVAPKKVSSGGESEVKKEEKAPAARPKLRRQKCKSPLGCSNFAEQRHNFCSEHECHTVGCKEHARLLTSPSWVHGKMKALSQLSSSEKNLIRRKCVGHYCKNHCCNRLCPEIKNYTEWWSGYLYWDNAKTEKFFFCDSERLVNSRYCFEHACKMPTCAACREETWKFDDGAKSGEQVAIVESGFWWHRWRDRILSIGPMCRAHGNIDPESVDPRDKQTVSDAAREKEAK